MAEQHFPGKTDEEFPAEKPAPEGEAPEGESPEAEKPEAEKPEAGEKDKAPEAEKPEDGEKPEPPAPIKKRSIYDDLKDTKKELKEAKKRIDELEGGDKPAGKPKDEAPPKEDKPTDELEAYAQEHELDAKSLNRLVEIIQKRIPSAQLSEQEKKDLADLRTWQAAQARQNEDNEIRSQAPQVRAQLKDLGSEIHDEAEAAKVMDEIVKLAHTERYHDKEIGYIVWSEKAALSKLISPKKPSFESGSPSRAEGEDAPVDFSSGKVTPAQAAAAMQHGPKPGVEIRRSS
jgi:hypothetical protein